MIRLLKTPSSIASAVLLAAVAQPAALAQPAGQPKAQPAQAAAPAPTPMPVHIAPPPKVAAQPSAPAPQNTPAANKDFAERGLAAVYSNKLHGRTTASGERYDRSKLTTAHPSLPFGTMLRVTHAKNKKSVVVRVNDRGPTQPGRIVDLSPRAAKAIGMGPRSMAEVTIEVVKLGQGQRKRSR